MRSHSVTCRQTEVRTPTLPPAKACTRFSDPGGIQGWVGLCYVKADPPGIEPATCKSQVQRPNAESSRNTSGGWWWLTAEQAQLSRIVVLASINFWWLSRLAKSTTAQARVWLLFLWLPGIACWQLRFFTHRQRIQTSPHWRPHWEKADMHPR